MTRAFTREGEVLLMDGITHLSRAMQGLRLPTTLPLADAFWSERGSTAPMMAEVISPWGPVTVLRWFPIPGASRLYTPR